MKVLLTFTGFNDPYSKSAIAGEERTGPILSLLAARNFDRVILFSTPSTLTLSDETAATITDAQVTVVPLNLPDPLIISPYCVDSAANAEPSVIRI